MSANNLLESLQRAAERHGSAVGAFRSLLRQFEAAERIVTADAEQILKETLAAGTVLRGAISDARALVRTVEGEPGAPISAVIEALCDELERLVQDIPRARIERLLQELVQGRPRADWRRGQRERARIQAVAELRAALGRSAAEPLSFLGPDDERSWLTWFWRLEGQLQDEVGADLNESWPNLASMLVVVDEAGWDPAGGVDRTEPIDPPIAAAAARSPIAESTGTRAGIHEEKPQPLGPRGVTGIALHHLAYPATEREFVATPVEAHPSPDETNPTPCPEDPVAVTAESTSADARPAATSTVEAQVARDASPERRTAPPLPVTAKSTPAAPAPPTPEATPAMAPDDSVHELPPVMALEEFRARFWLDNAGRPEPAPWTLTSFEPDLARAQFAALWRRDEASALLFAAAGEARGAKTVASPAFVRWLFDFGRGFVTEPLDHVDVERWIDSAISKGLPLTGDPASWLSGLFALFGPRVSQIDLSTAGELVVLLQLEPAVGEVVDGWHAALRRGPAADALARQLTIPEPQAIESLDRTLVQRRTELRDTLKQLFSAAGGKLQLTHCREAWSELMVEAHPALGDVASNAAPDPAGIVRLVEKLRHRASELFDRGSARFGERNRMDRAFEQLLDLATAVGVAAHNLTVARNLAKPRAREEIFSDGAVRALASASDTSEEPSTWVLSLVRRSVAGPSQGEGRAWLGSEVILTRPLLLEAWPDRATTAIDLDVRRCADPARAAARMLSEPLGTRLDEGNLDAWLAEHRPDLLAVGEAPSPELRGPLDRQRRAAEEQVSSLASRLRDCIVKLDQLADRSVTTAKEAIKLAEGPTGIMAGGLAPAIELAWLTTTTEALELRIDAALSVHTRAALAAGMAQEEIDAVVRSDGLHELLRYVGGAPPRADRSARYREAPFRADAEVRWAVPARHLAGALEASDEKEVRALLPHWQDARHTLTHRTLSGDADDALRSAFLDVIFRFTARQRKGAIKDRRPPGVARYSTVGMESIRLWLDTDTRNPTFLPQLSLVDALHVKVLPMTRRDVRPSAVAREIEPSGITVFLAPGLERSQREVLRTWANQSSGGALAVIDDLDLVRILSPGQERPDPMLALFEVVAEQQPWKRFCPYEIVEGQHVRMEMFVGRRDEAAKLVRQATYSRIFSGRRLGKSALLRFLAEHKDYNQVPSGNRLHVVFCPIAGMSSEQQVARVVVEKLWACLGSEPPPRAHGQDYVEYMKACVATLVNQSPEKSFLILLDEADTFFHDQVHSEATQRQQSLSWWMSRHAESERDRAALPRLRFVFCGYLHTDQNRGVWENKGDVLLLGPLQPEDAVRLVAAPLARMGIDARKQADAIAFRCGYQPVAIVRFGMSLLEHLERTRPVQLRDGTEVMAADVTAVLHRNEVQRSITETCWLNFVGHPLGQLVFASLLLEFADRAPGASLSDVGPIVLRRVHDVDPEFDPTSFHRGSWSDLVTHVARQLVERSLLVSAAYKPASFALRFPHHLPMLLDPDPTQYVRDALDRLATGRRAPNPEWLLTDGQLEDLALALGPEGRAMGFVAAAIPTHWPAPFLEPDVGVAERLAERIGGRPTVLASWPGDGASLLSASTPVILVGGAVSRRAIQQHIQQGNVEVIRSGRLTQDQIAAWFQRRRAAEFTAIEALRRLHEATSGIPLLVRVIDEEITARFPEAPSVGDSELAQVLKTLREQMPNVAARLMSEAADEALTTDEVRLLRLIIWACDQYGDDFRDWLCEGESPNGVAPYSPADDPPIRALLAWGLLPSAPMRRSGGLDDVGFVGPTDALRTLMASVPQ